MSLTAEETSLLAAVDGRRDEAALAALTGLPKEQIVDMVEQLALVGVLELVAGIGSVTELDAVSAGHIERVYELLDAADYYELLGVERDADKQAIKSAYYRVGPGFHPDRHYRKNLGPLKAKIELIFTTLTRAHDTLRYQKRREEYDEVTGPPSAGSEARRRVILEAADHFASSERKSIAAPPMDSRPARPSVRAAISSSPGPLSSAPGARDSFPGVDPFSGMGSEPAPRSWPTGSDPGPGRVGDPGTPTIPRAPPVPRQRPRFSSRPEPTGEALKAQREALARKLARSSQAPPPAPPPRLASEVRTRVRPEGTYMAPEDVRASAAEKLRKRFDMIGGAMAERRLERYMEQGRVAFAAGDYRAAAAAYDQAARLAPDNPEIAEKARQAASRAQARGR